MTAQHTDSICLPTPITLTHEHGWIVESRHSTSEGRVLYVQCAQCGARRIDLQQWPHQPPVALSREA
jgi:hypothetical protein